MPYGAVPTLVPLEKKTGLNLESKHRHACQLDEIEEEGTGSPNLLKSPWESRNLLHTMGAGSPSGLGSARYFFFVIDSAANGKAPD